MNHTITESDLEEWLNRPRWEVYASSGGPNTRKTLEADRDIFRVKHGDETVFLGSDRAAAVAAYNAPRGSYSGELTSDQVAHLREQADARRQAWEEEKD